MTQALKFSFLIAFATREYVLSHGKNPRGYGSWAFEFPEDKPMTDAEVGAMLHSVPREHRPRLDHFQTKDRSMARLWINDATLGQGKRVVRASIKAAFPQGGIFSISVAP